MSTSTVSKHSDYNGTGPFTQQYTPRKTLPTPDNGSLSSHPHYTTMQWTPYMASMASNGSLSPPNITMQPVRMTPTCIIIFTSQIPRNGQYSLLTYELNTKLNPPFSKTRLPPPILDITLKNIAGFSKSDCST